MKKWLVISLLVLLTGCGNIDANNHLDVHFFKVGKADSILVSSKDVHVLIDTGEDDDGDKIVDYLKKHQIKNLDALIVTHFDKDHVGGADIILDMIKVDKVFTPNYDSDSTETIQFMEALDRNDLTLEKLTSDTQLQVGQAMGTIFVPKEATYNGDNDYSLVISLAYGNTSFLFAGDAEKTRLKELLDEGNLKHTVLKVPHHGRFNKKTAEFFEEVSPDVAIITSSDKNPEDDKTLDALKNVEATVYTTRKESIHIETDGETLSVQ